MTADNPTYDKPDWPDYVECPGCLGTGDDLRDDETTCIVCTGYGDLTPERVLALRDAFEALQAAIRDHVREAGNP